MSNEGRGGSLGVLVAELESTTDSSSEDHCVATDKSVECWEDADEENAATGVEYAEFSGDNLGTE